MIDPAPVRVTGGAPTGTRGLSGMRRVCHAAVLLLSLCFVGATSPVRAEDGAEASDTSTCGPGGL